MRQLYTRTFHVPHVALARRRNDVDTSLSGGDEIGKKDAQRAEARVKTAP